jgi:hypothetical protein
MSEARLDVQLGNSTDARSAELKQNCIRTLNDQFRETLIGGRAVMTSGIAALGETTVTRIVTRVRSFTNFDTDNDPHHEHDFGAFEIDGHKVFFKLDYYDKALEFGSPDPADPAVTERVLTIMLAEEY